MNLKPTCAEDGHVLGLAVVVPVAFTAERRERVVAARDDRTEEVLADEPVGLLDFVLLVEQPAIQSKRLSLLFDVKRNSWLKACAWTFSPTGCANRNWPLFDTAGRVPYFALIHAM